MGVKPTIALSLAVDRVRERNGQRITFQDKFDICQTGGRDRVDMGLQLYTCFRVAGWETPNDSSFTRFVSPIWVATMLVLPLAVSIFK